MLKSLKELIPHFWEEETRPPESLSDLSKASQLVNDN